MSTSQPRQLHDSWKLVTKNNTNGVFTLSMMNETDGQLYNIVHKAAYPYVNLSNRFSVPQGLTGSALEASFIKMLDIYAAIHAANNPCAELESIRYQYNGKWAHPLPSETKKVKTAPVCTCEIRLMMDAGCQCGAFKEEQRLKKEGLT